MVGLITVLTIKTPRTKSTGINPLCAFIVSIRILNANISLQLEATDVNLIYFVRELGLSMFNVMEKYQTVWVSAYDNETNY
jgi:hypothetical protein